MGVDHPIERIGSEAVLGRRRLSMHVDLSDPQPTQTDHASRTRRRAESARSPDLRHSRQGRSSAAAGGRPGDRRKLPRAIISGLDHPDPGPGSDVEADERPEVEKSAEPCAARRTPVEASAVSQQGRACAARRQVVATELIMGVVTDVDPEIIGETSFVARRAQPPPAAAWSAFCRSSATTTGLASSSPTPRPRRGAVRRDMSRARSRVLTFHHPGQLPPEVHRVLRTGVHPCPASGASIWQRRRQAAPALRCSTAWRENVHEIQIRVGLCTPESVP